jgi:hypothetical protein
MYACFGKGHELVPEDPSRLKGPELGFAVYTPRPYDIRSSGITRHVQDEPRIVRVIERSYVWSPELHSDLTGYHGYRRYDWSVIEEGPDKYRAVVVDDDQLEAIPDGRRVETVYRLREVR